MNRNQVYDYLKGIDELKPLFYKNGRGYNVRFVPKVWVKFTQIIINDWYIENFYSITLLIQEMIIQGETSDMEIHISAVVWLSKVVMREFAIALHVAKLVVFEDFSRERNADKFIVNFHQVKAVLVPVNGNKGLLHYASSLIAQTFDFHDGGSIVILAVFEGDVITYH